MLNIHWKDWCWSFDILATWCEELTYWKKTLMLGPSPGEENSYPLQYSGLDNSMDCTVHRVAKSRTWLYVRSDAGKDWRQEEKGTIKNEMVGWHHQLSRHEFEQALGAGDGQGSLACGSPWGRKESDVTEQLNWTKTQPKSAEPIRKTSLKL